MAGVFLQRGVTLIWRGCFFLQRGVSFFFINHVESTSRSSKRKGGENPPPPPQQYPNSKQELAQPQSKDKATKVALSGGINIQIYALAEFKLWNLFKLVDLASVYL